jgi:hypothetical protein
MSSSRYRREGRNAFCPSSDPEADCPYIHISKTHARSCWIEGFYEEESYQERLVKESKKYCYQCDKETEWLAPDSRCGDCTRFTPDEIRGGE